MKNFIPNKMTVVKNGVEEQRNVDYVEDHRGQRIEYPVMADNERCAHSVDGVCTVYEVAS